jgi:hypothetical protein
MHQAHYRREPYKLGSSFGNALAWLLLLPGNLACNALGLSKANNRELVRMLVNSLAWTMVGVVVVSIVV